MTFRTCIVSNLRKRSTSLRCQTVPEKQDKFLYRLWSNHKRNLLFSLDSKITEESVGGVASGECGHSEETATRTCWATVRRQGFTGASVERPLNTRHRCRTTRVKEDEIRPDPSPRRS